VFDNWRAERRRRQEAAVIRAIGMLRPSQASGVPIALLAHMGAGAVHPTLARLEASGRVTSGWGEQAFPGGPRRRVYRVVRDEAAR